MPVSMGLNASAILDIVCLNLIVLLASTLVMCAQPIINVLNALMDTCLATDLAQQWHQICSAPLQLEVKFLNVQQDVMAAVTYLLVLDV